MSPETILSRVALSARANMVTVGVFQALAMAYHISLPSCLVSTFTVEVLDSLTIRDFEGRKLQ